MLEQDHIIICYHLSADAVSETIPHPVYRNILMCCVFTKKSHGKYTNTSNNRLFLKTIEKTIKEKLIF